MAAYGFSYSDIAEALEAANLSVGANYIQRAGEAYPRPRRCAYSLND